MLNDLICVVIKCPWYSSLFHQIYVLDCRRMLMLWLPYPRKSMQHPQLRLTSWMRNWYESWRTKLQVTFAPCRQSSEASPHRKLWRYVCRSYCLVIQWILCLLDGAFHSKFCFLKKILYYNGHHPNVCYAGLIILADQGLSMTTAVHAQGLEGSLVVGMLYWLLSYCMQIWFLSQFRSHFHVISHV